MSAVTLPTPLLEETSAVYRMHLVDEDGAAIDSGTLNSLTLTAYDADSQTIINGRQAQNILNAHDVTVETVNGVTTVTWAIQPADTVILNAACAVELHIAQFRWAWDAGRRVGAHTIRYLVENLSFVPPS